MYIIFRPAPRCAFFPCSYIQPRTTTKSAETDVDPCGAPPTGPGDGGDGVARQVVPPERRGARPEAQRRRLGPPRRGRCLRVSLQGCSHVLQPCQGTATLTVRVSWLLFVSPLSSLLYRNAAHVPVPFGANISAARQSPWSGKRCINPARTQALKIRRGYLPSSCRGWRNAK